MKDRITQYPHRYQLVPVSGQSDTYDIVAKPGTITEPGTPLNKANLLSDTTANLYGLTGDDATVDGALYTALANNKVFGLKDVSCVSVGPNSVAGAVPFTSCIFSRGSKLSFSTESSTKNNHQWTFRSFDNVLFYNRGFSRNFRLYSNLGLFEWQ